MTPKRSTIVKNDGIHQSTDPDIIGQVVRLTLDCGHVKCGNPSMHYAVGASVQCFECGAS